LEKPRLQFDGWADVPSDSDFRFEVGFVASAKTFRTITPRSYCSGRHIRGVEHSLNNSEWTMYYTVDMLFIDETFGFPQVSAAVHQGSANVRLLDV
jgi:hypothetical protein